MKTLKLKKNLNLDLVAATLLAVIAGTAWYFYWVQPRDEFFHAVIDCMGEDMSEAVYQECAGIVANSAR